MNDLLNQDSPSEEDFLPSPPKPLGPLSRLPRAGSAWPALWLWMVCAVASIIYWGYEFGEYLPVSGEAVFQHGEYYRLITAIFVHADFGHLLSNTPLFLVFGWLLYGYFGFLVFPVLSLAVGVLSNLGTVYFYSADTKLIGASGMVYGMVAIWLVLFIRFDISHQRMIRLFRAIAFTLAVMFPSTFQPQTSYLAHGFGFCLGLILTIILLPILKKTP